jgi:hypothetical protein
MRKERGREGERRESESKRASEKRKRDVEHTISAN